MWSKDRKLEIPTRESPAVGKANFGQEPGSKSHWVKVKVIRTQLNLDWGFLA